MSHGGEKAIKAALAANGAIAAIKLAGALLSGSASMLAEFKHSLADATNGLFLLAGLRQSRKPPDNRFQFGYGKAAFFWSFVAAVAMLAVGGAFSIYGGIIKILHPEALEHVAVNLAIVGASIVFETFSLYTALAGICQEGGVKASGSAVLPGAVKVLGQASPTTRFIFFEDSAALLGLAIAGAAIILSYVTGRSYFDGAASVLIGIMLLSIGVYTAKENMDSITGEAADPQLIMEIGEFVKTRPEVRDIHRVKSMRVGPAAYLLNLIVEGDKCLTLAEVDDINFAIKTDIEKRFPQIKYTHVTMIEQDNVDHWEAYCDSMDQK